VRAERLLARRFIEADSAGGLKPLSLFSHEADRCPLRAEDLLGDLCDLVEGNLRVGVENIEPAKRAETPGFTDWG
jgi:hypothetical protein